jgi:glycogen debranching enzyme
VSVLLKLFAFLYSKAHVAMQVVGTPGASTMYNLSGTFSKSRMQCRLLSLRHILSCTGLLLMLAAAPSHSQQLPQNSRVLELSRPVRPWEFLPSTGMRAALLGHESGEMEAWVYPLKLFRDFHLKFYTEGRVLPAEALARTLTVRPESATILYAGDTFTVRETFFVPVKEPGAIILLDVETEQPLEIDVLFHRDFQLEWPAALGATFIDWLPEQNAFYFGEEQKKFAALIGSPTATQPREEFQTNYAQSEESSFRLGVTPKGKQTKIIVIAGSTEGLAAAQKSYQHLASSYEDLLRESAQYYQDYLRNTVRVTLPDQQLQHAFDWARISTVQGLVTNPFLGTGLVAGYRTSGESQRPGFAWFFGRDSFWTTMALNAEGDFATTRAALNFISKYQREDGKMPHEISQGASFVNWFKDYPYPYASADATPLYIIAVNDYVVKSGDTAYAKEKWASLQKAYDFLRSTYGEHGFPKNQGVGHGWVEGGLLLPVKSELYQAALGLEALRALGNLAHITGQDSLSTELLGNFDQQKRKVDESFWLPGTKRFAFALDQQNRPVDEPSVLATVPMWFGLLNGSHADDMISQLAGPEHQTDWGMRIISSKSARFSGGGYHYGSVWPLFTGWAAVGEYKYHRAFPAYENLRANALLGLDGSLGHFTEVLSGDYYEPLSTSSPHQIWSAAMVVSPLLRGLFGLETDAIAHKLTFTPHVPADWPSFTIENVPLGDSKLMVNYKKTEAGIFMEFVQESGSQDSEIEFRPSISPRAKVQKVELNGKPLPFRVEEGAADQHIVLSFRLGEQKGVLKISLLHDFGLAVSATPPLLGSTSRGLRIVGETWSPTKDQVVYEIAGVAGEEYHLKVWGSEQIRRVEGGELGHGPEGQVLQIVIPPSTTETYPHAKVTIHF